MRLSATARAPLAGACHAIGGVWVVAGVLRMTFGVAVTFPPLPAVDLARVAVGPSLLVGTMFIALGAFLGRGARGAAAPADALAAGHGGGDALSPGAPEWPSAAPRVDRAPLIVRTPPA